MNCYETVVIFHPDLTEEQLEKGVEGVRERLAGGGAEISDCENWGKRRLAYAIRRQRYGCYVLFRYSAPPDAIREAERHLRISEQALKFLTVRCRPGQVTPPELLKGERGRVEEGEAPEPMRGERRRVEEREAPEPMRGERGRVEEREAPEPRPVREEAPPAEVRTASEEADGGDGRPEGSSEG